MLKQISIYAENKKGTMQTITGILYENDINILGSVTNDSAEYGIIRMVVSDTEAALKALRAGGFICKQTDVLGIEVKDEAGNLNKLLKALLESNINADYLYLSFNRDSGMPIMVLHTPDIYEVEACLEAKGFKSVKQ
ncbi:MAG: amino acid-binding protein [Blautia sp.]|nr:amino acid-binding protein [Blautia sp.]